ncbi:MAG: LacI family transcriptional regulator [Bacteroidales bacterium]|nr:LacI family transcriptional regulator [Bacteroidales bacterium]
MQNKLTIKDIAKKLGVSVSTVSRALKDHPDISEKTKALIRNFANEMNYRPNVLALSLRKQKSNTIGLIIPEIVHHFFSSVISGIEDLTYREGYNLIICQSNENQFRESTNLQTLIDHRVDGIIVSMSKSTTNFHHFKKAHDDGIPMVFFDRICDAVETDRVVMDDFEGGRLATEYLINKGCRNILHLAAAPNLLIGRNRRDGYIEALRQNNIPVRDKFILKCDTREEVLTMQNHILSLVPQIDAIFAVNDSTAIAVIQMLRRNGFRIPEDIRVIGFGDGPIATIVEPALTTVEQKGYDMGREAVRLLLQRLNNPNVPIDYQTRVFTPTIKVRDSA